MVKEPHQGWRTTLPRSLNCTILPSWTPLAHLLRHLTQSTWHQKIQAPGAGTWHLAHHPNLASGVCLKRAFKMQFRKAYFRSLVHPSRKLWPKPNSANLSHVFCLLNRWSLELNEGVIFEQNTFSNICLSIKM